VGLRIVGSQSESLDVEVCTIDDDGVEVGAAVPKFVADAGAIEFDPGIRAG